MRFRCMFAVYRRLVSVTPLEQHLRLARASPVLRAEQPDSSRRAPRRDSLTFLFLLLICKQLVLLFPKTTGISLCWIVPQTLISSDSRSKDIAILFGYVDGNREPAQDAPHGTVGLSIGRGQRFLTATQHSKGTFRCTML